MIHRKGDPKFNRYADMVAAGFAITFALAILAFGLAIFICSGGPSGTIS